MMRYVSINLRTSLKRIVIDMLKLKVDNTIIEQETDSAFSNLLTCKYTAVYRFPTEDCFLKNVKV